MILYNSKYKGPLEYDKFVLNIFQLANEAKDLGKNINTTNNINSLKDYNELINKLYYFFIGNKDNIGLSNKLNNELIKYVRC